MSNNNSKSFVARGSRKNGAIDRRGSQEKAFIRQEELQSNSSVEEGDDDEAGRGETCQSRSRQKRFSAGGEKLPLRRGLARSTVVKGQ